MIFGLDEINVLEALAISLTLTNIFNVTDVGWGWIVMLVLFGFTGRME